MKKNSSLNILEIPFYPFLVACYPVIALFQVNILEVNPTVILRPLAVSLAIASAVFLITLLIIRNPHHAALFTTLFVTLFFSYGHVYQLILGFSIHGLLLGRHLWLSFFYLLLFSFLVWLIFNKVRNAQVVTPAFNITALLILFLPILQIGFSQFQNNKRGDFNHSNNPAVGEIIPASSHPDIYYIILDMYTREDYLKSDFNFDNSEFISELEDLGFYIPNCSRSNYVQTELSLSSSLNMDYLQDVAPNLDHNAQNMDAVIGYIKDNRVRTLLEQAGYKTVAFDTGYFWDSWMNAKYYFSPFTSSKITGKLTPFEGLLLNTTALLPIVDSQILLSQKTAVEIQNPVKIHIEREQYKLDKLGQIENISGPKFVFAHILIPHFPFVFQKDGTLQTDPGYYSNHNTPIDEKHFIDGYTQQIEFVNDQIIYDLKQILRNSKNQPVIIIQGDHGARDDNRLAILNAYHLPGGNEGLYPTISPVNSFRLIINRYLNSGYNLLPDKSYFSPSNHPFQYEEKPELSPLCSP